MDSLQINIGEKRIAINDDPNRVIVFNPSDTMFAEKFYKLIGEFHQKSDEYEKQFTLLDKNKLTDENGIPVNAEQHLELLKEACLYMRERIDYLFGAGTSQTVFGDALNMDAIEQFFIGVTPYIQKARTQKIQSYTNKKPKRILK